MLNNILSNYLRSIIIGLVLETNTIPNKDLDHLKVRVFLSRNSLINYVIVRDGSSGSSLLLNLMDI